METLCSANSREQNTASRPLRRGKAFGRSFGGASQRRSAATALPGERRVPVSVKVFSGIDSNHQSVAASFPAPENCLYLPHLVGRWVCGCGLKGSVAWLGVAFSSVKKTSRHRSRVYLRCECDGSPCARARIH